MVATEEVDPPEPDQLPTLRAFLLDHYQVAPNPAAHIDGAQLAQRYAAHIDGLALPPLRRPEFYRLLRLLGFVVQPGTANRTQVYGIEPRPHAQPALQSLDARWPDLADTIADTRISDRAVLRAQSAVRQTLHLAPAVVEEAADKVLQIMRESDDEDRQLRAATVLLDRGIAKVRPREVEEEQAIEASAVEARPAMADIVALVKCKQGTTDVEEVLAESKQGANSSKRTQGEAVPGTNESAK